jgi:hypothetical protein
MKFLIKTSAVAVSDTKCANQGEYETTDEKEIERLKKVAKEYPNDVEVSTGKKKDEKKDDKKDDKGDDDPEKKDDKDPKEEEKSDKKDKK